MANEPSHSLLLRRARWLEAEGFGTDRDILLAGGRATGGERSDARWTIDLEGRFVLPAFVNAHDVLDLASLPPLGRRAPYSTLYDWVGDVEEETREHGEALAIPLVDRLFLGAMRNLLAGVGSVLHHHPDHRSLGRADFPVRVQRRYGFAHSPRLTPALRRTYRTSDRRVPWLVRAAEGADPRLREEIAALAEANVLRQNTVLVRGTALAAEDAGDLARARACLVWSPECDARQYGRTAAAAALRAAGVRIGIGSDAAPAGARDFLSTLAAASRLVGLDAVAMLRWATVSSAEVARLSCGGIAPGEPVDLLVTSSVERLLQGDRRAIDLLLLRGHPVLGLADLLERADQSHGARAAWVPARIDAEPRLVDAHLGRRLTALVRRYPVLRCTSWLAGVKL